MFFLIAGFALLMLLWPRVKPFSPALATGPHHAPDAVRLGDSNPTRGDDKGVAYLIANKPMMYPPPLMAMLPLSSDNRVAG